jgi:hypothetical protein
MRRGSSYREITFTLNDFFNFCNDNDLSFILDWSEGSDEFEIRVHGIVINQEYYEKKVSLYDLEGFCERCAENNYGIPDLESEK